MEQNSIVFVPPPIAYFFLLLPQLTVDTAACHTNLRVKAPLEIGTIPLQGEQTDAWQVPVVPPVINTVETSFQHHFKASTNASRAQLPTGKSFSMLFEKG